MNVRLTFASFIAVLSNTLAPKIDALAEHRWARSVKGGLLACLPLVILGATALLINHLPIAVYQEVMQQLFGTSWKQVPQLIWQSTFGIIALAMTASISYALAASHPLNRKDGALPVIASGVAIASFFALIHQSDAEKLIILLGNRGAFAAICNAMIATEIFMYISGRNLMPRRWLSHDADSILPHALVALFPAAITMLAMFIIGQVWMYLSVLIGPYLANSLLLPFSNPDNLGLSAVVMLLMIHTLWFFGIHGNITVDPLAQAMFTAAQQNSTSWIPHEVFSKPFFDVFIYQGGAGCTLGLLIAILIVKRKSATRRVAKVALPCALINVNEPVLFGIPVVLNPFYLLPFVLTPLLLFVSAALAVALGLVPVPSVSVEWTTPPLLGGWIATGSWRGAALQLVNLGLATLVYLPFVRFAEKARKMQNANTFNALLDAVSNNGRQQAMDSVHGQSQLSNLAHLLSADLASATSSGQLYLQYQPLTDYAGKPKGVEALLRWKHPVYGEVPPVLTIYLAEQSGYIVPLGRWALATACQQLGAWNRAGITGLKMSVNLSPEQLGDTDLASFIQVQLLAQQIKVGDLELEITETSEIQNEVEAKALLERITALGVLLALDDFGMGYSSILYLRRFPISKIKIDGSLTRDIVNDENCQEIIMSIAALCSTTHVEVVAEYVETQEQLKVLHNLGCHVFQGYLYSKPLLPDECLTYLHQHASQSASNSVLNGEKESDSDQIEIIPNLPPSPGFA